MKIEIDYLANHREFLPVLTDAMYDHWRPLLQAMGRSRAEFAESMQARCQIGSLPTALVAFQSNEALGTGAIKPQDLDIRPHLTPWLGGMFVLSEHRNRGLGSFLIAALLAEARRLGLTELYLWTPSSESLYARHGWAVVERTPYCNLEICVMHRSLRNYDEEPK